MAAPLNRLTEKTPLVLRADADSRIGTGHVMRCIALGQAWADAGGKVLFATCCGNPVLLQRLRDENFTVIELHDPSEFLPRLTAGLRLLNSGCWVVLDGYRFTLDDHRSIRRAGFKLLLIDDYNHLPAYECDILLNQNIDADGLDYNINPDARRLLGTQYAMLRREFRQAVPAPAVFQPLDDPDPVVPAPGKNILVTLGGADPDNVTFKVIEALQALNVPGLDVRVVVGPANAHIKSLKSAAARSAVEIRLMSHITDMTDVMMWSDFAISAAGSTCWELCCLGVPFLTLVLAENQRGLADGLAARGVAPCLGENPSVAQIAAGAGALAKDAGHRARCSEAGREMVDGFGALRVLAVPAKEAGLNLFAGRLTLRSAAAGDLEQLWLWANDPAVRGNSYHPQPIPFAEHKKWFINKLHAPDALILILKVDQIPVGQVRCDWVDADTAEIDFSIDAKFRGLGLGTRLIQLSLAEAAQHLGVQTLRAMVKETNEPSCRVFESAGFERMGGETVEGVPSVRFEKRATA
jgi:UDP-2,4-diacetamido-2,4,6-trideoxy-beta-L-altropyranose hydrolase